jgi:hypothetical protein
VGVLSTLNIPVLDELLAGQAGVLTTGSALRYMTPEALEWRVRSGRWQKPCRGIVVAHSGPLSAEQRLWVAALWAGSGAVLGGLTAARLQGLRGFTDGEEPIDLIRPPGRTLVKARPPLPLAVHYSRLLGEPDIQPARSPWRTRVARSLVDAASWRRTDRGAQAILAAGVQQGLVLPEHLAAELDRNTRVPRRALMRATIADIADGSRALSELDFLTCVIRPFRLPPPDRQVGRRDAQGRRRWLDAVWEQARLIVEIDGAGHVDVRQYWDDMDRDNSLKLARYDTLRYPSFVIRYHAEYVAGQIAAALRDRGMRW